MRVGHEPLNSEELTILKQEIEQLGPISGPRIDRYVQRILVHNVMLEDEVRTLKRRIEELEGDHAKLNAMADRLETIAKRAIESAQSAIDITQGLTRHRP